MNPTEPPKPRFELRKRHVVVLAVVCLPLFCAVGIAGYFRLGSDTQALRGSLMSSVTGQWEKKFAVHVGGLTLGLARAGARFVNLPAEPRAALEALHGAEVGVYRLAQEPAFVDHGTIFPAADRAMSAQGWERIVALVQPHELVGVYIPRKGVSRGRMACCLVVLKDRDLVVVSARGNVDPLMKLARQEQPLSWLASSRMGDL